MTIVHQSFDPCGGEQESDAKSKCPNSFDGKHLALETTEAGRYADCGRMLLGITFKNQTREFDYGAASDDYYEIAYADRYIYWSEITPKTTLTGSINIYVSPLDECRIEVSVNVRYDVVKNQNAVEYTRREDGEYRTRDERGLALDPVRWTLTTREPSNPGSDGASFCTSKGVIEEEILAFARR
jgi:hypothetical protein